MIIEIFIVLIDYHYYWLFYSIKSQESFCKFAYFALPKSKSVRLPWAFPFGVYLWSLQDYWLGLIRDCEHSLSGVC